MSCRKRSPLLGYSAAFLLALVAQLARLPFHEPTFIPHITYIPFTLIAAFFGGLGPGLLTTALCTLESLYFATDPVGSFAVRNPVQWLGLGAMLATGAVASLLFEGLYRAQRAESEAKQTEADLAQQAETRRLLLECIIEYSPSAIAILRGSDFVFEMVNPAYQALAPGETMTGRPVADVWPDAAPLIIPLLNVVREAQTVYHATGIAIPRRRGPESPVETRYFDLSYVPLPGAGEAADVRVLVVAIEVTEHKRAELALRNANQELTTIHAHIPLAMFVVDERFRVQKSSGWIEQTVGTDGSETLDPCPIQMIGCLNGLAGFSPCAARISCDECAIRQAALDSLNNGVPHQGVEARVPVAADGKQELRCLLVSTAPMELEGRKALICAQDITDRKRLEEEVERDHARFRRQAELINLSHDAIITNNAERVIQQWNQGAQEMYGWTEAEAVGRNIHDLLQTRPAELAAVIDAHLSHHARWDGEINHARRDGQRIIVDSRQILLHDTAGAPVGILRINRDITEEKGAAENLRKTVGDLESTLNEKTVLLKEVHHRVKNNLAVISSLLHMNASATETPEAKLALEESRQRVYSIALIHEQLYGTEHLDRINFAEYITQLVKDQTVALGAQARRIAMWIDAEPIEMGVHRAVPCALILNELVTNAFKHAFAGQQQNGEVGISFREATPGFLELRVQDNGVGFSSGLSPDSDKSVGWRIVKILAKQLGGFLEQEACQGTRFVLRFPAGTSRRVVPDRGLAASPKL